MLAIEDVHFPKGAESSIDRYITFRVVVSNPSCRETQNSRSGEGDVYLKIDGFAWVGEEVSTVRPDF